MLRVDQRRGARLASTVARRCLPDVVSVCGGLSPGRVHARGVGAFLYAALFTVEGVGLWRRKRWAEYLTVIATLSLVPLELFELTRAVTPPRLTALVVNLAVVAYLIGRLRRRARATSNGGPGPGTFEA